MSFFRNGPESAQLAHSGGPRPARERGHSAPGREQRDPGPRGSGVAAAEGLFAPSHTWAAVSSSMNGAGLAAPPRLRGSSCPRSSPVPAGPKGRQGRRAPRPPHASPALRMGGQGRLNQRLTDPSADHVADVGEMVGTKAAKGPQRGQTGHRPDHVATNQPPATKLSPLVRVLNTRPPGDEPSGRRPAGNGSEMAQMAHEPPRANCLSTAETIASGGRKPWSRQKSQHRCDNSHHRHPGASRGPGGAPSTSINLEVQVLS